MNKIEMVGLVDWVSDHVSNFGVFPGEFEDSAGRVWGIDEYMKELKTYCPAFIRLCLDKVTV